MVETSGEEEVVARPLGQGRDDHPTFLPTQESGTPDPASPTHESTRVTREVKGTQPYPGLVRSYSSVDSVIPDQF